jgi:uncharacterized protein
MITWREMLKQKAVKIPLELPEELPLLEVDDAVLLPKGQLPVHLDARARASFFTALAGERLLGVVQVHKTSLSAQPVLFKTGCLGRIVAFSENDEGDPFAVLVGLARFQIIEEKTDEQGTRVARVSYEPYAFDRIKEEEANVDDRERFLEIVRGYCNTLDLHPNWEEILKTSDDVLVTALAMMCPFEAQEKQALLETMTLQDRARTLTALMELACLKKQGPLWQLH